MSERYTHLDSIKVDGIASTSQQGALIGASKVMPQPSADLDGVTIQYMGPTDSTYTFKRMYTCAMVGSEYKWIDATPVDIVQNSNGVFIAGTEIGVADSTKYGVMSPEQSEKVDTSFEKLETVKEGAEPNKVDIIRVEGTPLQVSGVDKSVNITRDALGLGDSAQLDVGTLEGQIPVLGANGQLPKSTIPPYATGTYVGSVRTKALLTSLTTAEIGDWAKVTSDDDFNNNGAYILNGTAPGVLTNWVQMVGPANVESVNGKSGRVVLDKEDIGLANVDNTSDAKKPISEATQTALNDCVKLSGGDSAQVIANGGLQIPNGDLSVGGGALIGKDTEPALLRVRGSIEATQSISGALVQTEDVASDDSSTKVASTAWVNSADSVVHTAGDTMTGNFYMKYDHPIISLADTRMDDTTTPSSELQSDVLFLDKNLVRLASVRTTLAPNGNRSVGLNLAKGSQQKGSLLLVHTSKGENYVLGPTPPSGTDNSTKMATTAWVNGASTVVHTTGNETISGQKTFNNTVSLKSTVPIQIINATMPLAEGVSYTARAITVVDSDNNNVCRLVQEGTQTQNTISLVAYRGSSSSKFIVGVNDTQGAFVLAPSWSVGTNDNSDKVMTMKMANNLPSLVHTTGNETVTGNKIFSNGLFLKIPIETGAGGAGKYTNIDVVDNGGVARSRIKTTVGNLETVATIDARTFDGSNFAELSVHMAESGDKFALAPPTADTHPDTAIVTKKYLLDKIAALEARISALEGSQ